MEEFKEQLTGNLTDEFTEIERLQTMACDLDTIDCRVTSHTGGVFSLICC